MSAARSNDRPAGPRLFEHIVTSEAAAALHDPEFQREVGDTIRVRGDQAWLSRLNPRRLMGAERHAARVELASATQTVAALAEQDVKEVLDRGYEAAVGRVRRELSRAHRDIVIDLVALNGQWACALTTTGLDRRPRPRSTRRSAG